MENSLDKRILEMLRDNFQGDNFSTYYRLQVSEDLILRSWDGKINENKIPLSRNKFSRKMDFGVHTYHPSQTKTDLVATVEYYSKEDEVKITNKQIEKFSFIFKNLLRNSINSGLKGEIT